jgi:hypothetical protein
MVCVSVISVWRWSNCLAAAFLSHDRRSAEAYAAILDTCPPNVIVVREFSGAAHL